MSRLVVVLLVQLAVPLTMVTGPVLALLSKLTVARRQYGEPRARDRQGAVRAPVSGQTLR